MPEHASSQKTKPCPPDRRMQRIDLLQLRQISEPLGEGTARLGAFQQAQQRFRVSRSNLVPGGGNSLDLIPTLPRSPLHPLFERFGMRVERAGTAVELFRKQECEPLAACPRLPTRRELKF